MMRISAITCDTLLKLVPWQMAHQLSKDGLTGIHPSLSKTGDTARRATAFARRIQIGKTRITHIVLISRRLRQNREI